MSEKITVWSGVKIGCGIFIVLPLIVMACIMLFAMLVPSCIKTSNKNSADKLTTEEKRILQSADTNGDGNVTLEEYQAEMAK